MHKLIQSIKLAIGIPTLFLSSFGIVFGAFALIDPVVAEMSNDAGQIGLPPTFVDSLSLTLFYAGIFFLGVWIIIGTGEIRKIFGRKLQ